MTENNVIWIKKKKSLQNKFSRCISSYLITHDHPKLLSFFFGKIIYKIEVARLFKLIKNNEYVFGTYKRRLTSVYSDVTVNRAFHILTVKGWKSFAGVGKKKTNGEFVVVGCRDTVFTQDT